LNRETKTWRVARHGSFEAPVMLEESGGKAKGCCELASLELLDSSRFHFAAGYLDLGRSVRVESASNQHPQK
jgi:hypothetical protein